MKFSQLLSEHGYADAAFLSADQIRNLAKFKEDYSDFLSSGNHADMDYLERNNHIRFSPVSLMEGTKSLLVALTPYRNHENASQTEELNSRLKELKKNIILPVYAAGRDYHKTLRKQGNRFAEELIEIYKNKFINFKEYPESGPDLKWRLVIDTAPVPEKYLAWLAGLGFYGRNTLIIHPRFGSFFFISVFFFNFTAELCAGDEISLYFNRTPVENLCGACSRCETHCPGGALKDGKMNAAKCTSWAMLEKKENLSGEEIKRSHGWIAGCEICQNVCPWNGRLNQGWTGAISRDFYLRKSTEELITESASGTLTQSRFSELAAGSVIKRMGYAKMQGVGAQSGI